MTDTVAEVAEPTGPASADASDTHATRTRRILLALAAIAAVVPFFWAAVRDARNGFYPTMDVAATVVRARATFSANPPLLGMWSSGSSWAGHEIHFPGPILLYLLAVPTHLFGNTWGPLLGMAVINSLFVLVTGWLIHRYVGTNAALVAFAFLNAFLWSIGSENLIDPRPMEMVTIPFLCFLVLVWLVASGKVEVLPWLAVVANYLFLNHLVMSLQIPVIGMCAAVGVVLWIRRTRDETATATSHGAPPGWFARLRKPILWTAIVTFVMWLPSLIQQVTHSPGNLRLLVEASSQHRDPVGSFTIGFTATMRLIVEPTFWFRGRFDDPTFPHGLRDVSASDVVGTLVLVGLFVWLAVNAWRRRDRLVIGVLAVAVVGIGAGIVTVTQAPGGWGFPMQYLRSLWGLAAFVWFAVAFGAWRALAPRWRTGIATGAGCAAILFGLLGLSYANFGAATDMRRSVIAEEFVDDLVPQLEGRGTINILSSPGFESERFFSSALLAIDTAGIDYCVTHISSQQYGAEHDCIDDTNTTVIIEASTRPARSDRRLIAETPNLTPAERERFTRDRETIEAWVARGADLTLSDEFSRLLDEADPAFRPAVVRELETDADDADRLLESELFQSLLAFERHHRGQPAQRPPIFTDRSIPVDAIVAYEELAAQGTVRAYEIDSGPTVGASPSD